MSDAQKAPRLPLVTLDGSQYPQDIASARLPTPTQQSFCEPCKAFLRGDRTECLQADKLQAYHHRYIHHPDTESFQQALELPCVICIRLYKDFQRESGRLSHLSATCSAQPTRYDFRTVLGFHNSTHMILPDLESYESRPDLHHLHITPNTGDAKALSFLKNQYHKCREQHSGCQRIAPYNNFTPTRTIYVGSVGEEAVRLCDSVEMTAGSTYTVLSHCWGKNPQHIMLTNSTVEMLKTGIALSLLSKTFQDAIAVTRMFQIQYIWIDSLCIFQDDLHDWAAEASRMRDVYSNAEFCIAATDAESGNVGLFFDRDVEQLTPVIVETTWSNKDDTSDSSKWPRPGSYMFGFYNINPYEAIDEAPLNQRAWVAQERFLSPRTLHFTRSLLHWECHTSFTSENNTMPDRHSGDWLTHFRSLIHDVKRPELSVGPIRRMFLGSVYELWGLYLHRYTSCGITKESDIFIALAGIADEIGHAINDCLIAGLWKGHFIEELCWQTISNSSRPSTWRAPTWSWASLSGRIRPSELKLVGGPHEMAAIVEFHISTKPSGEVEHGSVLVECRLIPAAIIYGYSWSNKDAWRFNASAALDESVWNSCSEETNTGNNNLIKVQLDVLDNPCYHTDQGVDVRLLVLTKHHVDSNLSMLGGICVVNSKTQAGSFERVGYFEADDEVAKLVLAAYGQARVQAILLI